MCTLFDVGSSFRYDMKNQRAYSLPLAPWSKHCQRAACLVPLLRSKNSRVSREHSTKSLSGTIIKKWFFFLPDKVNMYIRGITTTSNSIGDCLYHADISNEPFHIIISPWINNLGLRIKFENGDINQIEYFANFFSSFFVWTE